MLRIFSLAALLLLTASFVQPQEGPAQPAPAAESAVSLLVENLTLEETAKLLAMQLEYTVSFSEEVDKSVLVSLELGQVPAWLAAMALGDAAGVGVRLHAGKKLVEVTDLGAESAHSARHTADFGTALKRAKAALADLRGEGAPPIAAHDPAIRVASLLSLFYDLRNGDEDVRVDDEGKLEFTGDEELAAQIHELARLLGSENGGQSTRLFAQAETWRKLRASRVDVVAKEMPLVDLCGYFRSQAKVPVLLAPGGDTEERRDPPMLSLKGLAGDTALALALESYGFGYRLCGNCVLVDESGTAPHRPFYAGFAVHELGPVLKSQKSRGADIPHVLDDLSTVVQEVAGSRSPTFVEVIGTRMVVGADQQAQHDVEQILRLLTEPPRPVVLPPWPTVELRLDAMDGRESVNALAQALKWQSWIGDTEVELAGRTLRGKPIPAWVAVALLDIASESRVELFPLQKFVTRRFDVHALHALRRIATAAMAAAEAADAALIGPKLPTPGDEDEAGTTSWDDDWFDAYERAFGAGMSARAYSVSDFDTIVRLGEVDAARLERMLAMLVTPGREPERAPEYAAFERLSSRRVDTAFSANGLDDCVQWLRDSEGLTIFEAPDLWPKEIPKVTLALKQATLVEVLDALCEATNIHWQLVHETIVLYAGLPQNLARHCTCEVYDLRPLVAAQPVASDKHNARRQRLKVIDEAVSLAMGVMPHAKHTNFALVGCRLLVCGDARMQATVLATLRTLGYEQK